MKQKRSRRGFGVLFWLLAAAVVVLGVRFASDRYYRMAYPVEYQALVEEYCQEFSVEPALCYAVIRTESSFNPEATSSIGARGLMQLTEETFDWVKSRLEPQSDTTYDAMYEPEKNIEYGTYLLHALTEQFGSVNNALCAYHAGWGSATSWLENPEYSADGEIHTIPYADTAQYVEKVGRTCQIYRELYGEQSPLSVGIIRVIMELERREN